MGKFKIVVTERERVDGPAGSPCDTSCDASSPCDQCDGCECAWADVDPAPGRPEGQPGERDPRTPEQRISPLSD